MTMPEQGWTPPADPAPAEVAAPVAPAEVPPTPVEVPPMPTTEVTTGPVAEAPASLPTLDAPVAASPVADPTPVTDAAPVEAAPADPTPAGSGDQVPEPTQAGVPHPPEPTAQPTQVQSASNGPVATVERDARQAAAKAFHVLGHLANAAREVQAEIARFVPKDVLDAAEAEALALLRELI